MRPLRSILPTLTLPLPPPSCHDLGITSDPSQSVSSTVSWLIPSSFCSLSVLQLPSPKFLEVDLNTWGLGGVVLGVPFGPLCCHVPFPVLRVYAG